MIESYLVGGCVRDAFLGKRSKDIDVAVEAPSFEDMKAWIVERGGQIFLEKPEFFTIRARVANAAIDFVLCRKEGDYSDGRHPDSVEPGTIYDDLARRDFTMNAIAQRESNGIYIDPHGGFVDLNAKIIRAVGVASERFDEDALRLLRAMRFSITMGFKIEPAIEICLQDKGLLRKLQGVSAKRQQDELTKCFQANTEATLRFLEAHQLLRSFLFRDARMWLMPTMREKPGGHQ